MRTQGSKGRLGLASGRWVAGLLVAGAGLAAAVPAAAQPWRYEDRKGVHYTSNPHELPPAQRAKVLAAIEEKRKAQAAAAAAAAEAAARNPTAPGSAASGPALVIAPAVPQPLPPGAAGAVVVDNRRETGAPPAGPSPLDRWKTQVAEAEAAVKAAEQAVLAADAEAERASQRALVTPSGPHFAAYEAAKKDADDKRVAAEKSRQSLTQTLKTPPPR